MVYSFHMPLFFLISGFLFSRAYVDSTGAVKFGKLKTQLLDLAAVYVIFSFLLVCVQAMFSSSVTRIIPFSDLLCIWRKPISIFWYLYILFFLYLANAVLVKFRRMTLLSMLFFILGTAVTALPTPAGFENIRRFFFFLPFFYLGTMMQRSGRTPNWSVAVGGLAAACGLYLLFSGGSTESYSGILPYEPIVKTIVALGLSIFFWKSFSAVKWIDNNVLRLCGRYCLEVYVMHCFLSAGLRSVFMVLGVSNFWVSLALSTILSTALPILFAMWLERLGVHDILFRPAHWFKRRAARSE